MNVRSLWFRLAVWYFCAVTAIFALAAFGCWFTIRWGLNTALDEGLGNRLTGLRQYLENAQTDEALVARLEGSSPFGLFEVFDEEGRRLLLILVDNAVKFTPTGGTVTLGARRDGADVVLSVADNGVGIAADDVSHIFERFWRADKVRSREVGGAGLGLPIARQIAEQHGAMLDVQSEPGRGSVFTLRIPAAFISDRATVA